MKHCAASVRGGRAPPRGPEHGHAPRHRPAALAQRAQATGSPAPEEPVDFSFTEEQELLRRTVREFMRNEVAPVIAEYDEAQKFPVEILRKMGELGIMGVVVPEEYGGAGLNYVDYVIVVEEISRLDGSLGLTVAAHNSLGTGHILIAGNEEQKRRYLPKLASGEWIAAWGLTEPGGGSDAAGMTSTAVRDGDHYVLNGTKNFITHALEGQVCVVLAKTDPKAGAKGISSFIVETDTPGYTVPRKENKLGCRASETSQIILDDCRVPAANLLGNEGEGFGQALRTLYGGRVSIAALGLGIAQGALDEALKFARERVVFGRTIGENQGIQFMLSEMQVRCEAARMLCFWVASMRDRGLEPVEEASMAKLYASEAAVWNTNAGLQIHGAYGYTKDYPIERLYRDAKVCTIGEGTSEIHRMVIARQLLKKARTMVLAEAVS
jgi:alkylation response protein AidB-like acyl-CoA dehydrogenase